MVVGLLVHLPLLELIWILKYKNYDKCGMGEKEFSGKCQLITFQDKIENARKVLG